MPLYPMWFPLYVVLIVGQTSGGVHNFMMIPREMWRPGTLACEIGVITLYIYDSPDEHVPVQVECQKDEANDIITFWYS